MPAAVAVPLILGAASTGAQIYASNKSAKTAKDASAMQERESIRASDRSSEAMRNALALNERARADAQASYAPYVQASQNGLAMLSKGLGMPQSQPSMLSPRQPPMMPGGGGNALSFGTPGGRGSGMPQPGMPGMSPQGGMTPQVGEIKTFRNGARGRWDGQGWEQIQ